jgi:gliding motility-associated-like protein
MKHIIAFVLIWILGGSTIPAQGQTNEGTDFWFAFMEHRDIGLNSMVAMITAKENTTGRISIPGQGWSEPFSVQANEVTLVTLPKTAETLSSENITQTGVHVTSQRPVSVYIHQYYNRRAEAAVVLPRETLGRAYYVMSYYGLFREAEEYPSQFIIVAREDDTRIDIRLADDTKGGRAKGSTFSIRLDAGETYQVQTRLGSGDLTGSLVTADKNFAIFGGARWTVVPSNCGGAWDNLLEQMYPIDSWGKQFITVPNASVNFDVFRILASEDNTRVEVHGIGTDVYELDAGEFVEYRSSVSTYIVGDKPILAAQYNVGSFCSGHNVGDPSMVLLNSIEQTRDTVTLYNSSFQNIVENYINVIARTVDIDFVLFDGQTFAEQEVEVFPVAGNNDFSFARVRVSRGSHTIIAEGCGVIATAYGYGDVESYAYSGGASFSKINANPIPEGGCLNDTIFFDTGLSPLRYSVFWDLGDGNTTTSSKFGHIYDQLGDFEVQLIVSDDCLMTIDTFYRDLKVTLRQAVDAEPDITVCETEAIQLGATDLDGARYEWKGPAGFFSGEQFPMLRNTEPEESGAYEVIGIISGCATFPALTEVTIIPTPEPDLGPDTIICIKNSDLEYVLDPGSFYRYEWSTGQLSEEIVVRQEGQIAVTVFDQYGCKGSDEVQITEQCPTKIYVPNAFSPNYDGTNDTFTVLGTDIESLHLQVFDRWGTLMFESTDFTPWDGRYRGQWVGPGVYVWVAVIEGFDENAKPFTERRSGSVTLVK